MSEEKIPLDDAVVEKPLSVSRRDFLRRTSTDVVKSGKDLLPGARLVSQMTKKPWWQSVTEWRQNRKNSNEDK